jgi:hypothetical protein
VGGFGKKLAENPGIKGDVYVLQTARIVENIFDKKLLPMVYLVATCLVAVFAIFIGSIFFMEIVGGSMWEQRVR